MKLLTHSICAIQTQHRHEDSTVEVDASTSQGLVSHICSGQRVHEGSHSTYGNTQPDCRPVCASAEQFSVHLEALHDMAQHSSTAMRCARLHSRQRGHSGCLHHACKSLSGSQFEGSDGHTTLKSLVPFRVVMIVQ